MKSAWILLVAVGIYGCSSLPFSSPEQRPLAPALRATAIELEYTRGHDVHRISIEAGETQVVGRSSIDSRVVREGKMDPAAYETLVSRLRSYIQEKKAIRAPASPSDQNCKSPYSLSHRHEGATLAHKGCRNGSDGFGKLVREAEFLLFSKKDSG